MSIQAPNLTFWNFDFCSTNLEVTLMKCNNRSSKSFDKICVFSHFGISIEISSQSKYHHHKKVLNQLSKQSPLLLLLRVSNLVVVDADDTNWHQHWQCQHWMTPIDTRMNWKIIYAGPAGLWKYNKIWSSGKCFLIHETSEMNFL